MLVKFKKKCSHNVGDGDVLNHSRSHRDGNVLNHRTNHLKIVSRHAAPSLHRGILMYPAILTISASSTFSTAFGKKIEIWLVITF